MIIRIEDAPNIKHISIDINFDDDEPSVKIDTEKSPEIGNPTRNSDAPKKSMMDDIKLDMDETYDTADEEIIAKPEIPEHDRVVKVAEDMESLEL